MKDGAEGFRDEFSYVAKEPEHTCPHIDDIIKEARAHSRAMCKAAKDAENRDEDDGAWGAMKDAESFADNLEERVEKIRKVNETLRTRGNRMEEIADEAIEALATAEAEILELRTQIEVGDKVRQGLVAMIQETWWHRAKTIAGTIALALADHAKVAFWRRRARVLAENNKNLRYDRYALHEAVNDQAFVLGEVASYLGTLEWTREGDRWGARICPECRTRWNVMEHIFPPDHDEGCRIGRMARRARRAFAENPPQGEEA